MADSAQPTTVESTGAGYEPYGQRAAADDTRQAQQTQSNDTPTDVNLNAVVGREQAGTFTLMGKNFEANADRRNKIFDLIAQRDGLRKPE